jgi:hypothetical protein
VPLRLSARAVQGAEGLSADVGEGDRQAGAAGDADARLASCLARSLSSARTSAPSTLTSPWEVSASASRRAGGGLRRAAWRRAPVDSASRTAQVRPGEATRVGCGYGQQENGGRKEQGVMKILKRAYLGRASPREHEERASGLRTMAHVSPPEHIR